MNIPKDTWKHEHVAIVNDCHFRFSHFFCSLFKVDVKANSGSRVRRLVCIFFYFDFFFRESRYSAKNLYETVFSIDDVCFYWWYLFHAERFYLNTVSSIPNSLQKFKPSFIVMKVKDLLNFSKTSEKCRCSKTYFDCIWWCLSSRNDDCQKRNPKNSQQSKKKHNKSVPKTIKKVQWRVVRTNGSLGAECFELYELHKKERRNWEDSGSPNKNHLSSPMEENLSKAACSHKICVFVTTSLK